MARWLQCLLPVDYVYKKCPPIPSRDSGLGADSRANSLGDGPTMSKVASLEYMIDLPRRRVISVEEVLKRKVALKDF